MKSEEEEVPGNNTGTDFKNEETVVGGDTHQGIQSSLRCTPPPQSPEKQNPCAIDHQGHVNDELLHGVHHDWMVTLIEELLNNLPVTRPALLPNAKNKITSSINSQRKLQQGTIENYLNRCRTPTRLQISRKEIPSPKPQVPSPTTKPIITKDKITRTRKLTLVTREAHTNVIKNNMGLIPSNNSETIATKAQSEITNHLPVPMEDNKIEITNNIREITSQERPITRMENQNQAGNNKPNSKMVGKLPNNIFEKYNDMLKGVTKQQENQAEIKIKLPTNPPTRPVHPPTHPHTHTPTRPPTHPNPNVIVL